MSAANDLRLIREICFVNLSDIAKYFLRHHLQCERHSIHRVTFFAVDGNVKVGGVIKKTNRTYAWRVTLRVSL